MEVTQDVGAIQPLGPGGCIVACPPGDASPREGFHSPGYHYQLNQQMPVPTQSPYSYFSISNNKLIYTSPVYALLDQPEFQNISNLQQILPGLDKTYLNGYLNNYFDTSSDYDLIGKENKDKIYKDCAILTSK